MAELGTMRVKSGLAEMLKGGVIMDVTTADQAKIAEDAGAVAGMALERVPADIRAEGGVARMAVRTKGEAGTGNVVEAVRHMRKIQGQIRWLSGLQAEELVRAAKELNAPVELVRQVAATGKLPVVNFSAGGLATPADAALMMQLGVDGNFVGSGIFKSADPAARARAIVEATTYYNDPDVLAKVSRGLGDPMRGQDIKELGEEGLLQVRGW